MTQVVQHMKAFASQILVYGCYGRFFQHNDLHTPESLKTWLHEKLDAVGGDYQLQTRCSGPAFLTEPLVRSQTWKLDPGQQLGRDVCEYLREIPGPLDRVPHFLPGQNPFLDEIVDWYGLPLDGIRGGADTIYPEYRNRMVLPDNPPEVCTVYCTLGMAGGG